MRAQVGAFAHGVGEDRVHDDRPVELGLQRRHGERLARLLRAVFVAVERVAAVVAGEQDRVDLARIQAGARDAGERRQPVGAVDDVDRVADAAGALELRLDARHERSEKAGTSRPLAVTRSAATEPCPPPSAITAMRRPRARGERTKAWQASTSSPGESTRTMPASRQAAAITASLETSAPVCEAAPRAPAAERPLLSRITGFWRGGGARGLDEGAPVGDVLGVDGDRARRLVAGQMLDELGQADVGLVADRGEARQPEAAALEQHADLEREVAGLRDQAHRPARDSRWRRRGTPRARRRRRCSWARASRRRPRARARPAPARARAPPRSSRRARR